MPRPIEPQDLVIHVLNVGNGDTVLIEFPADQNGKRAYGLVDCYDQNKTMGYLEGLMAARPGRPKLEFVCATHPHYDHIKGIGTFLEHADYRPETFWDSGFRHNSRTYQEILEALQRYGIEMVRVSSGMEWYLDSEDSWS